MVRRLDGLLLLSLVIPACDQVTPIGDGGACVPTQVQAAFDRSCGGAACHTNGGVAGGLGLGNGQATSAIGRTASGSALPLIEFGNTAGSYLAQKIMASPSVAITGEQMPPGISASNANQVADVNTILAWVSGGEFADCGTADTGTDTGTIDSGLPCEVDAVLAKYCRSCHGDPPIGATFSLLTIDDLLAAAPSDPTKSLGEQSVARMNDAARPMPPAPATRPSADELAIISDWLAAGMPMGSCTPAPDPFAGDPVCTSNKTWTGGNEEDPRMRPGHACIACHTQEDEGPVFCFAGTVYPTGHEPNECYGVQSILVQVTDAQDRVVEVKSNSAGNFMLEKDSAPAGFAPPYRVKVISDVGERVMAMPATTGDCNTCHTLDGSNDAPGRIVMPW